MRLPPRQLSFGLFFSHLWPVPALIVQIGIGSICFTLISLSSLGTLAVAQSPIADPLALHDEGNVAFTEGPAWHPSGSVFFTDIVNDRIMRRDRSGALQVYRVPSGQANGLLFDYYGRLIAAEGGNRRVTRTELDGTITIMAAEFEGQPFNSPNDVALDSRGRIYFSDPRYGSRADILQRDASDKGREIEGVYRIDGPGQVSRIITHEVDRPNGLAVSPGDRYLYVADNVNDGPRGPGGNRKLWRFDLRSDGTIDAGSRTEIFDWGTDRGPDGLVLDTEGRLYVAAGFNFPKPPVETATKHKAGVYVLSPAGELLSFIPVPTDMVTNCTFGGDDFSTLYVTAGHTLWSVPTRAIGYVPLNTKLATADYLSLQPAPQPASSGWWMPRHEQKLNERKTAEQIELLMIGDSITHGWENAGREVFAQFYGARHALNLGFSGDRTENVLWRLEHGAVDNIAPRLAVIMIGTNNTGHRQDPAMETAAGIEAIVSQLRRRLPETKILLLGIFPRAEKPSDRLRLLNDEINRIIRGLADYRHVYYLDLGPKFLAADGTLPAAIMPDFLHPNAEGYRIWAEAMEPEVKRLLESH